MVQENGFEYRSIGIHDEDGPDYYDFYSREVYSGLYRTWSR